MFSGRQKVRRFHAGPLVTLFAVLFAVFAMHGLASHESAHGESTTSALPVVVADDVSAAHGHGHGHGSSAPDEKGHGGLSSDPDGDLGGGVCLALLGLVAGLVAFVLLRGGRRRPLFVLGRACVGLLPRGRAADPPCLHRLSVMRC